MKLFPKREQVHVVTYPTDAEACAEVHAWIKALARPLPTYALPDVLGHPRLSQCLQAAALAGEGAELPNPLPFPPAPLP